LAKFDCFRDPTDRNTHWSDARLPASLVGLLAGARAVPGEFLVGLWSEPALGVIRLDAGTHASYGRPFQFVDFYDSTPEIVAFSFPPKGQPCEFNFIHDAMARGCNVRLFEGDERPTLAGKGPKRFYGALFVESTREGLLDVNTSLMTKEGMEALMGSVAPNGVLCYHISHRHYNLKLPLADAAKSLGYAWRLAEDHYERIEDGEREGHFSCEWFVLSREARHLPPVGDMGSVQWSVPAATGRHLWRDGQRHDLKALDVRRK
jgi:hypothetical protein